MNIIWDFYGSTGERLHTKVVAGNEELIKHKFHKVITTWSTGQPSITPETLFPYAVTSLSSHDQSISKRSWHPLSVLSKDSHAGDGFSSQRIPAFQTSHGCKHFPGRKQRDIKKKNADLEARKWSNTVSAAVCLKNEGWEKKERKSIFQESSSPY